MEKKYILSIDSGGSNIRAFLFDKEGNNIEKMFEKTPPLTLEEGAIEHDPMVLWESLKNVVNRVIDRGKYNAENIAAIGITNQRASFLLWEKETGKPVTNLISWADVRATKVAKELNKVFKFRLVKGMSKLISLVSKNPMINVSAMVHIDTTHATARLGWVFKEHPELKERAERGELLFGTLDSWFIYKLSGGKNHFIEITNASATGLYNHFQFKWNSLFCGIFGYPMSLFPEVKETIDDFGTTDPRYWGAEIPIKAVAGDQMSALFGHGCFKRGDVKISQGSGSFIDVNVGEVAKYSKRGLLPMLAWKIYGKPIYLLEGIVATVGTLIDWLGKGMGLADTPKILNEFAAQTDNTNGVIFIPTPSGIQFPYFNSNARASIFGLSLSTHRKHLARAVLEGIALRSVEIIKGIEKDTKLKINSIRVDGGVSQSSILLQILADLSGIIIERSSEADLTATGVAYMAGYGAKFWDNVSSIEDIRKMIKQKYDVFEPNMDEKTREKKLKKWQKAVKASLL